MTDKPVPKSRIMNPAIPRDLVPKDDIDLYARALALSTAPRKTPIHQRVLNWLYWGAIIVTAAWFIKMSLERDLPIRFISREVINPDKQVAPGERVLIHAVRERRVICPLVKRHSVIDGAGRREEYEAEVYDAYGPVTEDGKPDEDVTGPVLHFDVQPGRGRVITTFSWHCNMLQRAISWPIVYVQTHEFEIVPRKPR